MKGLALGITIALLFAFILSPPIFAQKIKVEEIVAKHIDSLGPPDARAAAKNRMAVGRVQVRFISQKNQLVDGRVVLASEAAKNYVGMSLNAADYTAEKFIFDGKRAQVGFAHNGARSILGSFIQSNAWILEDSLFAGTLAASWVLTSPGNAKLSSDGMKKIDGREVYVIGYSRKGGGDLDVKLYFDKETFRHVRTEYRRMSSAGIGRTPEQSSGFVETRYRITEDFSSFAEVSGLMLPHTYKLHYSVTGQSGTTEIEWNFDLTEFAVNQKLDENTFSTN